MFHPQVVQIAFEPGYRLLQLLPFRTSAFDFIFQLPSFVDFRNERLHQFLFASLLASHAATTVFNPLSVKSFYLQPPGPAALRSVFPGAFDFCPFSATFDSISMILVHDFVKIFTCDSAILHETASVN